MASSAKRRRCADTVVVFYTVQKGRPKSIMVTMKRAMEKLGVSVVDKLGSDVTHIVTGFDSANTMWDSIGGKQVRTCDAKVVSLAWHAESVRSGRPQPYTAYVLPETSQSSPNPAEVSLVTVETPAEEEMKDYGCQRKTPLSHFNKKLTDALELLEEEANLRGTDVDYSRALAFRNCSCVLKALPRRVTSPAQIKGMKDVGKTGHCLKVITDVLGVGFSAEVERVESSEWFQSVRTFKEVFGVGVATANDWFTRGLHTMEDVLHCEDVLSKQNTQLAVGLAYHVDLAMPVTAYEAEAWRDLIYSETQCLTPGASVDITGGFRRGKAVGHDVDLLLSHPKSGLERDLLPRLLNRLRARGLIIYGRYEPSTFNDRILRDATKHTPLRSTLDHFEKWIGVVRMNVDLSNLTSDRVKLVEDVDRYIPHSLRGEESSVIGRVELMGTVRDVVKRVESNRDWVARRVDLIVTPASQYYYALVGWTGSKHFNRSARYYASKVLNLRLTSHGLWDPVHGRAIPATSEQDVFENLKLEYHKPGDRNC